MVGLKRETFEELLKKAGIPCQYFCRKSFATWDVLLPTEHQAAKLAANYVTTKYFRLQPEYRGTRRLRVTICNVPAHITGEVLAAYLSSYGQVEEFNLLRSPTGTAYGDYAFRLCLTRDGFKAIPETLISRDRQMIVMVEGRRPRCWSCKQIGHISKFCPDKPENTAAAAATTATAPTATTTISKTAEAQDSGQVEPKTNDQEGWSEVTRKRRGSPKQGGKSPIVSPPQKQTKAPATAESSASTPATKKTPEVLTTTKKPATVMTPASPPTPASPIKKTKKKKTTNKENKNMEITSNLKRRRDSGEGAAKKNVWGTVLHWGPIGGPLQRIPPNAASPPTSSKPPTAPGSFSATLLTTTSPTTSANVPSPWVPTTPTIFTTPITTTKTSPTNRSSSYWSTPIPSPVEKHSPTPNCACKESTISWKTISPKHN